MVPSPQGGEGLASLSACASASDGSLRLFNRFRIFRGPRNGGRGGDLSLFNFLQISADGEGTGGGGHRLRCEHVSCVCACV